MHRGELSIILPVQLNGLHNIQKNPTPTFDFVVFPKGTRRTNNPDGCVSFLTILKDSFWSAQPKFPFQKENGSSVGFFFHF